MSRLGGLTVYLNANSSGLERGLSKASGMLRKFAAASAGYLAASSLKNLAEESLNLAGAQEKAENLMARTLKNTAGMADTTVGELKRYAAEVQSMSIFGDEKVMEAQTALMQMNSVTGDAFRMARSAAVDIASAKGQDLTAVMQNLGKALQDPVKGLRMLREYGTDPAMKAAVEQRLQTEGKEAAQLMILADLQKRYAGAAQEAANTVSGAFAQNRNALGDLKEGIGFLIDEIFDIRGSLQTSAGWFGDWATYLRERSGEIGFALRSVWTDIKYDALKLYATVAPVINQIASIAEAAANNLVEFYRAIPKLLNGEDFEMNFYRPAMTMIEEYRKVWETFDALDKARNQTHDNLARGFALKVNKQAEDNLAKGAAKGTAEGVVKGMQEAARKQFDAPSAVMGSADAWSIILKAAAFKSSPAAAAASAAAAAAASGSGIAPAVSGNANRPGQVRAVPASPSAAGVTVPSLFRTSVSASTVRGSDTMQTINDLATLLNPISAAAAVANPFKWRTAWQTATAPQAQNEGWFTRGLMAFTSMTDRRNNGVRNAASLSSPISREEVDAARAEREKKLQETSQKQLTVLEKINQGIRSTAGEAANLFGGWW